MDMEFPNPTFLEAQRNFLMPTPPSPSLPAEKRKAPQYPELFKAGGKKRKLAGGPVQAKNALVTLNEYKTGLEYVMVDQRGPVHQPTFVIGVTVNGVQYLGEGGDPPSQVPGQHSGCAKGPWSVTWLLQGPLIQSPLYQGPGWGLFDALKGPQHSCDLSLSGPRSWPSWRLRRRHSSR